VSSKPICTASLRRQGREVISDEPKLDDGVHEELSHGVGEAGEVGQIHLIGSGKGGVLGADEAYMGQRVDTELVEGVLRLGNSMSTKKRSLEPGLRR
jgi:hypothetical protein